MITCIFSLLLAFLLAPFIWGVPRPGHAETITWTDTSSGSSQESYFLLESAPSSSGPFTVFGQTEQDAVSYVFSAGAAGSTAWYRLKGVNDIGHGPYSEIISYTVPAAPPPPPPPPPGGGDGLVLALGFNDGTGTTVSDSSGRNNHGTRSGASWTAIGRHGGALVFDGVNDWVTVPHTTALNLTTGMTLEAWVFPTSNTGARDVILKQRTHGDIYNLYARTGNGNGNSKPEVSVHVGGTVRAAEGGKLPLNTWSHLAGTYNGSTLRVYINGAQTASRTVSGPMALSTEVLRIGGNSLWGEYFKGLIDEVRVWNVARTPAQIVTDSNMPIS